MRILSLPALLLLLVSAEGQQCSLTMWVYQDQDSCYDNATSPLSKATIYADKTCRTVVASSNAELFPGTYIAECSSDGSVLFTMSGCNTSDCSVSTGEEFCDQSFNSIAPFYSIVDGNDFQVQDPASQDSGFFCNRLSGAFDTDTFEVSFAIFGNCTTSECQGSGPSPSPVGTPLPSSSPTSTTDLSSEASSYCYHQLLVLAVINACMFL